MPKKLHRRLMLSAERLGLKGDRKQSYVYGTLQKVEQRREAKQRGR
jgi:hypothetical protein